MRCFACGSNRGIKTESRFNYDYCPEHESVPPVEVHLYRPFYKHNCETCIYLGHYAELDLYFCPQRGFPTVIARYGSDDGDYESGLYGTTEGALLEAKQRAIKIGALNDNSQIVASQ